MSKFLPFLLGVVLTCVVLFIGLTLMVDDGADTWAAKIADVPEVYLIGSTIEENGGIIDGYIAGREDAESGNIPFCFTIPQPYHYGYYHGYADFSSLSYAEAFNQSSDNAFASMWEEDVKHG